jgi:hypothetical protein
MTFKLGDIVEYNWEDFMGRSLRYKAEVTGVSDDGAYWIRVREVICKEPYIKMSDYNTIMKVSSECMCQYFKKVGHYGILESLEEEEII